MAVTRTDPPGARRRAPLAGLRGVLHGARWTFRLGRASALAALALALLSPFLVLGQDITAPSWVRARVEAAAAEALGGGALRFESIALRLPADLHPEVRLEGVTLADRDGREVARVPVVDLQVSPRGLLLERRLLVQEIALRGAELRLSRARDGSVELAFGGAGGGPRAGLGRAAGLLSVPEQFEALLERPALEALRTVRVEGLVVNYEDARAGRSWTVDGGDLSLDLAGGATRLAGSASLLSGRAYVGRARLDYESPRGSRAASLSLAVTDVAAADVASQSPALTWLGLVDAPISLSLRASLDEAGALGPASMALKIAGGTLRPGGAEGVRFEAANAYLAWDPGARAVRFDRVEVRSDWGGVEASGSALLREVRDGLPRALLGQFELTDLTVGPPGLYPEPLHLPGGSAQFRLRLDPFAVEVAEASLALPDGGERVRVSGEVGASAEGWRVALDARLGEVERDRVLALWPASFRPGLRWWVGEYLTAGRLGDLAGALRLAPGAPPAMGLTAGFEGVTVRPLPTHPPIAGAAGRITWDGGTFTAALDRGRTLAPLGGALDLAGTAIAIRPGDAVRSPATVTLAARGPITAALALLDLPPWRLVAPSGLPPDMAQGTAEARGSVDLFVGPMTAAELGYDVAATLRGARSDALVPGWTLAADALELRATPEGLRIEGPARLGEVPVEGSWAMGFAPEALGRSVVEARAAVTPATLAALGIVLPEGSVAGEGAAEVRVTLDGAAAPGFAVRSDLVGLRLAIPEVGWSKGAGAAGELVAEGRLGTPPVLDRLAVSAPGLAAEGDLRLTPSGGFGSLALSRLRVGGWLDAPVRLTAREGSDTPAVAVEGGTLDLAASTFGSGGEGEGGPIAVELDSLGIAEGIALTGFVGEFSTVSGLEGSFSGQVNGGPPVTGRVAPQAGRVAARVQGPDAGAVLAAADIFTRAEGGALDMLLTPVGEASYEGQLWVTGLKVTEAPVLASLLNAASVIGLLQQLGGQGIVFDQVAADFRIDPTRVIVARSSAVGAGLGLSMDGVWDSEADWMDFRGVVSPFYILNAVGSVLTRPGEGLFGFNYTLTGDPDDPQVGVNPLSVLTPGMMRDIFRAAPP